MGVTIKDVAEAAGVSISTVSKVLNGHYSISEKTAQRVRGIMREMNYYPNANAQSFASGSNHTVVLLANLAKDTQNDTGIYGIGPPGAPPRREYLYFQFLDVGAPYAL